MAPTGDTGGSTAAAVRDAGDGSYFVTYTLQIGTYQAEAYSRPLFSST
jgi:hypothetical protein